METKENHADAISRAPWSPRNTAPSAREREKEENRRQCHGHCHRDTSLPSTQYCQCQSDYSAAAFNSKLPLKVLALPKNALAL